MFLRNVRSYVPTHTASHLKRTRRLQKENAFVIINTPHRSKRARNHLRRQTVSLTADVGISQTDPNVTWATSVAVLIVVVCSKTSISVSFKLQPTVNVYIQAANRLRLKCDGTRAETRFRLSAKRTSPFKSAEASVQSTAGSRGVRISGSNAGYTMF
jgi:hypothetical protein